MASLRQLKDKIKTFSDFKKIINIQKIVIIKEINRRKKIIQQIIFRNRVFNNYLLDIHKAYKVMPKYLFVSSKSIVPIKRNLHFIVANPDSDKISQYINKLFLDHFNKNHNKDDLYIVIGTKLAMELKSKDINVIHSTPLILEEKGESSTYQRIAFQILRGFSDLMFVDATFIYLNAIERKIHEEKIFPFESKKIEISNAEKSNLDPNLESVISNSNVKKSIWIKDIDSTAKKLINTLIEMKVHKIMTEHRLSMKLRELQSLDDKEKTILDEIFKINIKMTRARKENITNELLTNATAFQVLGKEVE